MLSSFSYNPRRAEAERAREEEGEMTFFFFFRPKLFQQKGRAKSDEQERELKNAAARERAEWRQECRRRRRLVIRPEKK
jgi:hypothetical protein